MEATTPERPTLAADVAAAAARQYETRHQEIVDRLRRMADDVERTLPSDHESPDSTPRFAVAAQEIQHRITWDLANIGVYYLTGAAARADAAEALLAAEQTSALTLPHDCTSCGASMEDCDRQLEETRKPCCGTCRQVDTHGDTPSTYEARLAARKASTPDPEQEQQ